MSYLLDKKNKRKNLLKILVSAIILFLLIYFQSNVFGFLSSAAQVVFRPFLVFSNNLGDKLSGASSFFSSKKALMTENEKLKSDLLTMSAELSNHKTILDENFKLKEILGRKRSDRALVLSAILSKPNRSPYDTLVIDVGTDHGIDVGSLVFSSGDALIGKISEASSNSSRVVLFSSPGENTEVVVSGRDVFLQLVGRGGGNFEMILPRDFVLPVGTEVHLAGLMPHTIGIVQAIISDPRDSFQKALLASPVNIQELKFVQVGN